MDGGTAPIDGSGDVTAEAAGDASAYTDATGDAVPFADSGGDAPVDATADTGSADIFVPDVFEEPPSHCAGAFECVPTVPSGWSGPFELYASSTAGPACSANFAGPAYEGYAGLSATTPTCGCTCATPTGVSCSSPVVSFFVNLGTTSPCSSAKYCQDITLTPGACTEIGTIITCPTMGAAGVEMTMGASIPTGGSCQAMPSKSIAPPTWGTNALACVSAVAPAQTDCGSGSVCAPLPAPPFGKTLCISQPGSVPCPATGYTTAETFYGAFDDGRACTTCTCGNVSGGSCSATLTVSSSTDGTCSANAIVYDAPINCDAVQEPGDYLLDVAPSAAGSCAASAVSATGSASPATPTTFCCLAP